MMPGSWRVPFFDTTFGAEEEEAVLRPLRAGWLTMGEEVVQLESELKQASGAKHAIAVTNCTAALHLASAALGIGPGDEVLCPTMTFCATANAPRSTGASVRFCESVGPDDLTIDPESIIERMSPRTRALFVVHYAGFSCQIEKIIALANEQNVPVVEDCAHALFTSHHGKTLGLFGKVGCFSFFSNKNATCGEGGALLTDDDALADRMRLLRSHGMTTLTLDRYKGRAFSYDVTAAGFNYRLDEIRAALMRAQLRKLPGFLIRRRELFSHYLTRIVGSPVTVPFASGRFAAELAHTGVHLMPVLLPTRADRLAVMEFMKQQGIQTSIHYPLVHEFTAYRDKPQSLPRTEDLGRRQLSLPFYPGMQLDDVDLVVKTLLEALDSLKERRFANEQAVETSSRRSL
jgi:dTDP-4-amino-4,6-dideoxygalactose transaminase